MRALDRLTLAGIGASILVLLQPWWADGFRVGFFLTLAFVVLQIATSHLRRREDDA